MTENYFEAGIEIDNHQVREFIETWKERGSIPGLHDLYAMVALHALLQTKPEGVKYREICKRADLIAFLMTAEGALDDWPEDGEKAPD